MTGVIKAGSVGLVIRSIADPVAHRARDDLPAVPVRSPVELALDEARDEISRLQTALLASGELADRKRSEAFEAGRKEGRSEAGDDLDRRIASLKKGVDHAQRAWHERLAELDGLAVMLAQSALAKVFGEGADLADLVTRAIAVQVPALRDASVIRVRVSATDFPDAEALAVLRSESGVPPIEILSDPALAAGACTLDLTLGQIDLGIQSQWRELDAFLATLASDSVSA